MKLKLIFHENHLITTFSYVIPDATNYGKTKSNSKCTPLIFKCPTYWVHQYKIKNIFLKFNSLYFQVILILTLLIFSLSCLAIWPAQFNHDPSNNVTGFQAFALPSLLASDSLCSDHRPVDQAPSQILSFLFAYSWLKLHNEGINLLLIVWILL